LLAGGSPTEIPARPLFSLELESLLQGGGPIALLQPAEVGVELAQLEREGTALALLFLDVAQEASHIEAAQEGDSPDHPGDGSPDAPRPLCLHGPTF
jgi:hypothetical protein